LSVAALVVELSVTADTLRRWKGRDRVEDRSHTAHRLQTTLTPAQEAVVVALRQTLWLPLDDLLVITREFINAAASRSGVSRLLNRQGISRLPMKTATREPHLFFTLFPSVDGDRAAVSSVRERASSRTGGSPNG
jgi:hypothetical protein